MIKSKYLLFAICVISIIAISCTEKVSKKSNGWYLLDSSKTDSIGELIVSVKDFDSLKFESWEI